MSCVLDCSCILCGSHQINYSSVIIDNTRQSCNISSGALIVVGGSALNHVFSNYINSNEETIGNSFISNITSNNANIDNLTVGSLVIGGVALNPAVIQIINEMYGN